MKKKKNFSNKIILIALLILAVFFGYVKYNQYQQYKKIEAEKQKILAQIEALEKKNKEISESLNYFNSEGFKEKIAREQLNLKKPDEQIFSFKEKKVNGNSLELGVDTNQKSNFQKWILYFFGHSAE